MPSIGAGSVVDYSNYDGGCDNCGNILSQVRGTVPAACFKCGSAHFCSPKCFISAYRGRHREQCKRNIDTELDLTGANILTSSQALWDLRRYTARWHDELGDAAIAALNLHSDPSNIDKLALVVYLSYIPKQQRRMQRFWLRRAEARLLETLVGPSMDAARRKREQHTVANRGAGMIGSALIVLACDVPQVGLVFNSTFIGPEPDLLMYSPPLDWEKRLQDAVKLTENAFY